MFTAKNEKNVFSNQSVLDSIKNYFYPVKLDISSDDTIVFNKKKTTPQKFARLHHIQATPTTLFLNSKGKKIATQPGFISVQKLEMLLGFLAPVISKR